jgi:nitroreductase
MLEVIRRRVSVRSYLDRPLDAEALREVEAVLARAGRGVFGGTPRFLLVERSAALKAEKVRLGTYGFIQGNPYFVAGAIAKGPRAEVDYGYVLEGLILELTRLGLGTCWLGGTFSRGEFAKLLKPGEGETIPAVCSLGLATPRKGLVERVVRWGASADARLAPDRLFFDADGRTPFRPAATDPRADVLEAVRRGPSASNRQPWRVVVAPGALHLFLERTPGYGRLVPGTDLQALDAGIALRHLEVAAAERGVAGRWTVERPVAAVPPTFEFVASWVQP